MSCEQRYEKTPGAANLLGQQYEYKMAALLLMRGVNQTAGFCMGTNVAGAGAFDDVVFKYKLKDYTEFRTTFMQLKHNEKGNLIITLDQLVKPSGNFSMYKYYKSWCEVAINVGIEKWTALDLFNVDFSNCDFVIYTNGRIDNTLTEERQMARRKKEIFATTDSSPQYKPSYFTETTVNMLKVECNEQMKSDKALKDDSKYVEKNQKAKDLRAFMENHPVEEFLQSLQWFTGQASEKDLDSLIEEEIKKALNTNENDTKTTAKTFIEKMKQWWEGEDKERVKEKETRKEKQNERVTSVVLTETAQLWGDIVISHLNSNHVKRKEMEALNISFTDQEIDSFNQSLSSSLVINVTSPHVKLTGLKISQALEKKYKQRYILMGQEAMLSWQREVLRAWQSVWCDVLVIECSTDAKSLAQLSEASPGKKLILLSESALPGYQQHHDIFTWNQLEATSQTLLMEKQVIFQGYEVSLGSVVGKHCTHALTGDVVTQLLSPGAKLTLGEKIPDNISYYIPRSLERSDYITAELFSPKNLGEYFFISNVKEQDVTSLEDSYSVKLKKYDENQDQVPHHFYWTDNTFNAGEFTRFCQKILSKNVHWLTVDQSNLVYWKQSFNNMDLIKTNLESTERIMDSEDLSNVVNERVVLVAAEPGMGKTTYLNNVAQVAKSQDNSLWTVRLDLNKITRHLEKHTEQYFTDYENVADLIIDLSITCELDGKILRSRLTQTGNVNMYLDGYDEISPYYNDKVTNMIKNMMHLKVGQIWLTSRNVMRDHLESKLISICYSMKPFTVEDQISFLVKLWSSKHSIQIDDTSIGYAKDLLKRASESFNDRDREFTRIPLQCMMLGEVFAEDVKRGDLDLPNRLDLLLLFEKFISEKLNILHADKDQIDASNPREIAKKDSEKRKMMKKHSHSAILLLLSDKEIELFKVIKKSKITSKAEKSLSIGNEWTGLIDGMTDGKPSFIHRCFAEYFLAWWLSENISSSTEFIAQNLFEPRFVFVRQFFDRLLARDCPLHNAVLSADREQVEALLTSGADVNQLDKEGRSALHLVVDYCDTDRDWGKRRYKALGFHDTAEASTIQLLLSHKADVNLTDRILQGTPLRYADRSKSWGKVEHLLKNKAHNDGLVELRELINTAKKRQDNIDKGIFPRQEDETNRRIRDARSTSHTLVVCGCFHILQFAVDECELQVNTRLIDMYDRSTYLLHAAAKSGREDSVKFLLGRGADMMLGDSIEMLPIHYAARAGRTNIIPLVIESINVKDGWQVTPLHHAAWSGHLDTVKWLVDAGAEVGALDGHNKTPLHWAMKKKHVEVAKYLIEAGADVNAKDRADVTPLHHAAESGEINIVMLLLKEGAELNAKTKKHGRFIVGTWEEVGNETPLHWAVRKEHVEVAKFLIEAGADVNAKDSDDIAPLHYAAESGEINTVMVLLREGAQLNAKTKEHDRWIADTYKKIGNETPLHWAMKNKRVEVAKYLIEAGADVNAKDSDDVTALHYAAESGQINTVMILLKEGAELDAKTKVHRRYIADTYKKVAKKTPLHWAMKNKHVEVAKYLIEAGADQHCADSEGNTPASLAHDLGPEFIKWLSFRNNK